jgi:hypothetical protein
MRLLVALTGIILFSSRTLLLSFSATLVLHLQLSLRAVSPTIVEDDLVHALARLA